MPTPRKQTPKLPDAPPMWTLDALAAHLGMSEATVRRAIAHGELRAYKYGRSLRIDPADVDKWRRPVTTSGGGA